MSIVLSKELLVSFCGNVTPLWIVSEESLAKEDIVWSVDGDAVALRRFSGEGKYSFNDGVLLLLNEVGTATVTATVAGQTLSCSVIVTERKTAKPEDHLNYYIGDMHDHTSELHKPEEFAEHSDGTQMRYINYLKNENMIDFGVISDHAGTINDTDFFKDFVYDEESQPRDVVLFPGAESEIMYEEFDRFGMKHRNSGEIVTFNSASYGEVPNWEEFVETFRESPLPVAIFAHPQVLGFSTKCIWDFAFHKNNTPEMLRAIRGVEMGRGTGNSLLYEHSYSVALDNGFRVSTTCSSDSHGPVWGYYCMPAKTVIMSPKKDKEYFLDALLSNRFYGTESGNVKLTYRVNGITAPADLPENDKYIFGVNISLFHDDPSTMPVRCEVISDGGRVVKTITDVDFSSFKFIIRSKDAGYFYLRLIDSQGRKTWSPPVWTGRPLTGTGAPDGIEPIATAVTAIDLDTGKDATAAVDGDYLNSWIGEERTASLLLTLDEETEISALGHMPHVIIRPKSRDPQSVDFEEQLESPGFPHTFAISTSLDGEHFDRCYEGTVRIFGNEQIFPFAPVKAKYVKFEVLSTVGTDSYIKKHQNNNVYIGNLTLFQNK